MYKGTRKVKTADGATVTLTYEELCKRLGFIPEVEFVELTNAGTITFTVGKPEEIKALYAAVLREGFKPARNLAKTQMDFDDYPKNFQTMIDAGIQYAAGASVDLTDDEACDWIRDWIDTEFGEKDDRDANDYPFESKANRETAIRAAQKMWRRGKGTLIYLGF